MRVLFRDILKWGELKQIGDCSFVELENHDDRWLYNNSSGLVFDFEPPVQMPTNQVIPTSAKEMLYDELAGMNPQVTDGDLSLVH